MAKVALVVAAVVLIVVTGGAAIAAIAAIGAASGALATGIAVTVAALEVAGCLLTVKALYDYSQDGDEEALFKEVALGFLFLGAGKAIEKGFRAWRGARAVDDFAKIADNFMHSSDELLGVEKASDELIDAVSNKRRVVVAAEGSEELRMLDYFGAEASVGGEDMASILLRENPSKAAILEEFLHGTQHKLGIIDDLGRQGAEAHVKDFMIRHQKMLGLGNEDVEILKTLMGMGL